MSIPLIFNWTAAQWKCWAQLITSCTPWELVFADSVWALSTCWSCNCNLCDDLLPPYPSGQPGPMLFTAWPNCTFWYQSIAQLKALLWDTDVYVKTDDTDVAWYLWPKIVGIGCIKKRAWVDGANHTVELYLDKECLDLSTEDLTDWPVPRACPKVTSIDMWDEFWCQTCDDSCVKQHLVSCGDTLSWECDECSQKWLRKPRASMMLLNNITIIQPTQQEKSYYFSNETIPALDWLNWIWYNTANMELQFKRHEIDWSKWYIEILAPGDYSFSFQANAEVNKWVGAIRVWLQFVSDLETYELVQSRFSWLSDDYYPGQTWWSIGWSNPVLPNNTNTSVNWGSWFNSSLGRLVERLPNSGSHIWHFYNWAKIVAFAKISTFVNADTDAESVAWQLSFRWYGDDGRLWNDCFKFEAHNIDDTCDREYWNKRYSIG